MTLLKFTGTVVMYFTMLYAGCAKVQSIQYLRQLLGKLHCCCLLYNNMVYIYSINMSMFLALKEFYRLSVYGATVISVGFGTHFYMKIQQRRLEENVYKKMEEGNKPRIPHRNPQLMIAREDLSNELFEFYFPGGGPKVKNYFGVVIGPTGTGKSALVTSECNKHPGGVLYYNACEPQVFSKRLAEAIGMKIGPSNILDLLLGYFSSDVFVYYHLPGDQLEAIDLIFKNLTRAAERFKDQHKGKVPTLFIDGSDVICKFERDLFHHLLQQAKELANAELLTIVFVSSEGSIIPMIQHSSTSSRSVKIFEVMDISDSCAINDLKGHGLSSYLSERVVRYTGGRFVYLNKCKVLYDGYKKVYEGINDDILYEKFRDDIFIEKLNNQEHEIKKTKPLSGILLKELAKKGKSVLVLCMII